jgi:hypothetical protein
MLPAVALAPFILLLQGQHERDYSRRSENPSAHFRLPIAHGIICAL